MREAESDCEQFCDKNFIYAEGSPREETSENYFSVED
jgi:hypothetical protein